MNFPKQSPKTTSMLIKLAAFIIIIAGLHAASALIVRFLLAMLIAFICAPIFFKLNRIGLPEWLSLSIVLVLILLFGGGMAALIGSSINDFTNTLPVYQENLQNLMDNSVTFLNSIGIEVSPRTMLNIFDPNMVMNLMGNLLSTLTGMLSDSVLIVLMVIFMLLEAYSVPLKVGMIWGAESTLLGEIKKFTSGMQRYIFLKTIISLATAIFIGGALLLIGVDFALLWGLLAFLLNYIPNIGSIIASIPPILLSLFQLGWAPCLEVTAVYLAVNNVIGNFLEPRIMGKGLDLSPLVVFISVIFWGWVLGPIGMLLAVPLTMSAKIYLERKESTHWIAQMLAGVPLKKKEPLAPEPGSIQ